MLKRLTFLSKKEGIDSQAFIEYYENHHVPLVLSLAPAPIVYKRRYLLQDDHINSDGIGFDAVTELGFPDQAAYLAWRAKLGEQVAADELNFLDRSRTRSFVVEEYITSE